MKNDIFDKVFTSKKYPIWIYWDSGWDNAPALSQICAKSWQMYHPVNSAFELKKINWLDVTGMLDLDKYKNKRIDPTAMSDIVRLEIVNNYGGLWVDSTVLCLNSLDSWLLNLIEEHNFWSYNGHVRNAKHIINSSWFIASSLDGSYIMKQWIKELHSYWLNRTSKDTYFWVFFLFSKLYYNDPVFKRLWDNTPHLDAYGRENGPHFFAPYLDFLFGPLTEKAELYIENISEKTNVLKLTRHESRGYTEESLYDNTTAINALLKNNKLL